MADQLPFKAIGDAVAKQFKAMTETGLFATGTDKDQLWETYLGSFPAGTNPIYKKRTEHDCSCCRQFIKSAGGVVTIVDGKIVTLWDIQVGGQYQPVVDALAALVRQSAIANIFMHPERSVGSLKSIQLLEDKSTLTWQHFFVNLPADSFVTGVDIGMRQGKNKATYDVMLRGLREITLDSIDTTLELISQNSLYRGEEHKGVLTAFRKLKKAFAKAENAELFCWANLKATPESVARIRNTAIGTLLTDLSEGTDLEEAVKKFEKVVAPTNYKRPTALVTKAMIDQAKKTIEELGFMSALERRYATIEDITINNVLFANREAKQAMNVFDGLAAAAPVDLKKLQRLEEIPIEKFLADVLPKAEALEIYLENRHAGNLVSLVAPADPTAPGMFKWPNNFSWSYAGELTDSIKERVKQAGGNVTGDFRASLSWHNYDDLDLHLVEPDRTHIYYGSKISPRTGGNLDVDMNAGGPRTRTPVENIAYPSWNRMKTGTYRLYVNQFNARETTDVGLEVELEFQGTVYSFAYPKALKTYDNVEIAEFRLTHEKGGPKLELLKSLPHQHISKSVWGLTTQAFQKVNVVMLSPNHWDGHTVGNKHYFFMLDKCANEAKARGFFNEFLSEALAPHRKVLEVVGSRMKTDESDRQLSGLGFSSTQRNSALIQVKGNFSRIVKVTF